MKKLCPGFTLVELLLVVSIMAVLFSLSTAYYNRFNRSQILNQAALELKNNFRLAQSMASTGEKPSSGCDSLRGYQVAFFSGAPNKDFYTVQARCSNDLAGDQRNFYLPAVVRFQSIPPPFLFKVLAGGVEGAGTITLSAFGINKTVTVTSTGEVR